MYCTPSPSPVEPKSSVKSDPCAQARSAIRRQGAVHRRHPRTAGSVSWRSSQPRQLTNDNNGDSDRDRHATHRRTQSPVLGLASSEEALLDLPGGSVLSDFARREASHRLLRDALRHGQPGRRPRIPREPSLRFEMPSLPWSSSDSLNRSSSGEESGNRQLSDPPPFTPRFAPAYAYHSEVSQSHPDPAPLSPFPRLDAQTRDETTTPNAHRFRRVGHRSVYETDLPATSRRPNIDGLGDRQRSLSPEDDPEADAWETLLNTITPDVHLPSADSSFASTVASTAASASTNLTRNTDGSGRSNSQTQTQPSSLGSTSRATMRLVIDSYPFFNPCDYPTSSDSDTEADSEVDQRRRRHRARRLPPSWRSSQALGSTQDSQPPAPSGPSFSFTQDAADPDLQQMQAILDRLARREDIPDEWWAAAGLSRTIGRRLGAGEDPPNDSDVSRL